jgi:hypothetical protein
MRSEDNGKTNLHFGAYLDQLIKVIKESEEEFMSLFEFNATIITNKE